MHTTSKYQYYHWDSSNHKFNETTMSEEEFLQRIRMQQSEKKHASQVDEHRHSPFDLDDIFKDLDKEVSDKNST